MKKSLLCLFLFLTFSCQSQHIDLSGNYDFVIKGEIQGTLLLQQHKKGIITGVLYWNLPYSKILIYQVTGKFSQKSNKVDLKVLKADKEISLSFNPVSLYSGKVIDSNTIAGTLMPPSTDHWMAIRKTK